MISKLKETSAIAKMNTITVINTKTKVKNIRDPYLIFTSSQHEYELNERLAIIDLGT